MSGRSLSARAAPWSSRPLCSCWLWAIRPRPLQESHRSRRQRPTPAPITQPTPPSDLRITALTSYSVSLSWTAATSPVGIQAYLLATGSNYERAPGDATSWTFRTGIRPNNTYTLYVGALDNNNRNSQNSPFVTFTTPADTTPPAKPTIQATNVGDNWISLAWSSAEDGPITYTVTRDSTAILSNSPSTAGSFGGVQPETTYTFSVEARDFVGFTVPSDSITVTTRARINDVTPPTAPALVPFLVAPDGRRGSYGPSPRTTSRRRSSSSTACT